MTKLIVAFQNFVDRSKIFNEINFEFGTCECTFL